MISSKLDGARSEENKKKRRISFCQGVLTTRNGEYICVGSHPKILIRPSTS